MDSERSRTRTVLTRGLVVLLAIYLVLAVASARPLRALAGELVGVVSLWALYAVRFAFNVPLALAPEVLWFRVQDWLSRPREGGVVFTGSSTIAHWSTLTEDMRPLVVVRRGINGARLNQIAAYANQLVYPHAPRCVVVYAGENDLAGFLGSKKKTPDEVLGSFQKLCQSVHARLPTAHICFISIKPAKTRISSAPRFLAANLLVHDYCARDSRRHFIDATPALLDAGGAPRKEIFDVDGIHLSGSGYRILTTVVKPILLQILSAASTAP